MEKWVFYTKPLECFGEDMECAGIRSYSKSTNDKEGNIPHFLQLIRP